MADETARALAVLEEILAWTKFGYRDALLRVLETELKSDAQLLAYELSDGYRTQKEVGETAGIHQTTVSDLWKRWRRLSIVREVGGKVEHIARPSDLGMERAMTLTVAGKTRGRADTEAQVADGG
jgi:hypothetical protein